jgi:hypothetical protein
VFFANGYRIARLVKEDGLELTPRQQNREQARVTKEVERCMKAARGNGKERGAENVTLENLVGIGDVLAVASFSNPRRVDFRGRPTLVFDFAGDRRAAAQGSGQILAREMAGTIWIDETDRQVARVEKHFYEDFGTFVVKIRKGAGAFVDQSPLGDGLWMPVARDEHIDAKVGAMKLLVNTHVQDSDFRKFSVDTASSVSACAPTSAPPKSTRPATPPATEPSSTSATQIRSPDKPQTPPA